MRLSFTVGGAEITCTVAGETLSHKQSRRFDGARVAELGREALAVLTRGNKARKLSQENLADLRHVGEALFRELVPEAAQGELRRGAGPLTLELDEALVAVPWELLHDGECFLCRRWDVGRQVATAQPRRGLVARSVGTPVRILVLVSDPRGDLAEVQAEGEAISAELDKHTAVRARVVHSPKSEFVQRYLKDYDLVHFAGHADYVPGAPAEGGWHIADGKLSAREVAQLGGGRPMPILVFSNACQSGHTEPWRADDPRAVYGLANAFLLAGVRHYVGTQWEVVDGQSASFAAAFYAELVTGAQIGSAVRRAREAVVQAGGEGELAWASYVLYGDPEFRPLARAESGGRVPIPSAKQLDARASAPWKRPRTREPAPDEPALRGAAAEPAIEAARPAPARPWLVPAIVGLLIGVAAAVAVALALLHR